MSGRCVMRSLWGLYCPGCGGTRALFFLLTGHPVLSLWYNPIVLYVVAVAAVLAGSRVLSHLTGGRTRTVRFRTAYVYLGLAVLLINWLLKNYLLIKTGMAPIP